MSPAICTGKWEASRVVLSPTQERPASMFPRSRVRSSQRADGAQADDDNAVHWLDEIGLKKPIWGYRPESVAMIVDFNDYHMFRQ
jgi:hypothetical protein